MVVIGIADAHALSRPSFEINGTNEDANTVFYWLKESRWLQQSPTKPHLLGYWYSTALEQHKTTIISMTYNSQFSVIWCVTNITLNKNLWNLCQNQVDFFLPHYIWITLIFIIYIYIYTLTYNTCTSPMATPVVAFEISLFNLNFWLCMYDHLILA
jgi:hypothetical protein